MSLKQTIISLILTTLSIPLFADTNVSGTLSTNTTWTAAGSPYVVTGTVTVSNGVVLTVEPGVLVKFNSATSLDVRGKLSAIGTSGSPITFTSSAASPTRGSWGYIDINASSNPQSQLSYATISYGGGGAEAAFRIWSGSASLDHVTITESSSRGIRSVTTNATAPSFSYVTVSNCTQEGMEIGTTGGQTPLITISDSTFTGNGGYGIDFTSDSRATITNTTITNNGDYAISAEALTDIQGLTGMTVTGNGSGTKNVIEHRSGGQGARDQTWRYSANLPHQITYSSFSIASGWVLTIEPGTTVKLKPGANLTVNGKLVALGTSAAPITFTSTEASPTRGSWGYININASSNPQSQLSYVTISYGGGGAEAALRIWTGSASLDHVTITESSSRGIRSVTTNATAPLFSHVTVSNCSDDGMELGTTGGQPALITISDSTFTGNGIYGIDFTSEARAILTNTSITNNTDYAISAEGMTDIQGLTGMTVSGNGSGTKNMIEHRSGGQGARDQTWRYSANLPHQITYSSFSIASGWVLTIEPGTTVKLKPGANLTVNGKLVALGTSAAPITFTSTETSPTRGSWGQIHINATTNPQSQLSYATISYGGGGSEAALRIGTGTVSLDHVTITESSSRGIRSISTNTPAPAFSYVTVSNCSSEGIEIGSNNGGYSPVNTITDSTFTGNGSYGINFTQYGRASISNTTITNNANFAISAEAPTDIQGLTGMTASGNGSGAKNAIEHRIGSLGPSDQTWRYSASLPHQVTSWNTIGTGWGLTIDPGTTVKFNSGSYLTIYGKLTALGTSASPITFTSSATSPTRGSWAQIFILAGTNPTSQLSYVTISYGGGASYAALRIDSGSVVLDHVTVTESSSRGIRTITSSATASSFSHLTVSNCTEEGIEIGGTALNTIAGATLTGNGGFGLRVIDQGKAVVSRASFVNNTAGGATSSSPGTDVRLSFWNSESGPSGSGSGTGQSVNANILFEPWLTTSPALPQFLRDPVVKNRAFNPSIATNGTVSAVSELTGTWNVVIRNSSNTVLRTYSGSGTAIQAVWDGKDSGGAVQPNGTYSYEITSTAGSDSAAPGKGLFLIDTSKVLTLTNFAIAPVFFSPNSDGQSDTTQLTATANFDDTNWTVLVKAPGGSVVRTGTGVTGSIGYTWDGKNESGTVQPDSSYTLELSATAGTGSAASSGNAVLDVSVPVASFTAPTQGQLLSNFHQSGNTDIQIVGTASDANITEWFLDYGAGPSPSSWSYTFASGNSSITAALLGIWKTLPLANGVYTVRLRVRDQVGNETTATVTPTVGNFKVVQNAWDVNGAGGGTVTYSSHVPFTLTETLTIKNSGGQIVRTLANAQRAAGTYTDAWNGRNDQAALVPDGPYSYFASVTDGTSTFQWDLSNKMRHWSDGTGPPQSEEPLIPSIPATYSPFNGVPITISYGLGTAARVTLAANNTNFFYSTCSGDCIISQQYQPAGNHSMQWFATRSDGSSFMNQNYIGGGKATIAFPQNVVVLYGSAPTISNPQFTPVVFNPTYGSQVLNFNLTSNGSQPVALKVEYLNQSSVTVLRTLNVASQSPGAVSITWDGKGEDGRPVAPGAYTAIIKATDSIGNQKTQHAVTTVGY